MKKLKIYSTTDLSVAYITNKKFACLRIGKSLQGKLDGGQSPSRMRSIKRSTCDMKTLSKSLQFIFLFYGLSLTTLASSKSINFEKQLWPILERSCLDCHNKERIVDGKRKKPKGGLRIDSPKMIMYGAKGDPIITSGDAGGSSFYHLTILDKDDDDIMPAKGDLLTKSETDLIKDWINQGAHFGSWTGSEPKLSEQQINLINELNKGDIVILPLAQGSVDLYVDLSRLRERGTDQDLQKLSLIMPNIIELNLLGTQIKDLSPLSTAKNLKNLNLSKTAISDESLIHLSQATNLKSLNLFGTKVATLSTLPSSLKKLYLAKTAISAKQIKALQSTQADLLIFSEWDLSEAQAITAKAEKNSATFNGKSAPKKVSPKKAKSKKLMRKSVLASGDILFDDFETGTYKNWTITGTAFGKKPVHINNVPSYQGDLNAQGKYLVNSHASTKSDKAQGTMTSMEFTITKNWIRFLIGGGKHQDKTCVQLLVTNKVIATAHGKNKNSMQLHFFETQ
ncbi:hypothetical protein PQO03_08215 [Lentisphaera profundi]|uniref:Cytochrome C Planctomycete-type domain-containing protein n=1 Tax=Lentisphaera profundi TaxID=1658616 RepID=A0ABY7VNJ9_9BACT|nr:c-type cytochrome domain-containing protein [Lentisphaera profundi]WDE95700.1 hypothetical protein PQO03_08215 [Lentisphaera profundi]